MERIIPRPDAELLAAYVDEGDEGAFAELVRRYQDMVHGACWRRLRNSALAQDAAQLTFLLMVQKARVLRTHANLAGWLYQTANYQAANLVRKEAIRAQAAAALPSAAEVAGPSEPAQEESEVTQHLDEALLNLRDHEREAVVLRFFSGRSLRDVGTAQGTTEEAARKRVTRALERMAEFLRSRGIASGSVAAVTAALTLPAQSAPAGFTGLVTASARGVSLAAAAGSQAVWWVKVKVLAASAVVAAIPFALQWSANRELRRQNEQLRLSQALPAPHVENPLEHSIEIPRRAGTVVSTPEPNRLLQLLDALLAAESQQRQMAKVELWKARLSLTVEQAAFVEAALREAAEVQRGALHQLSSGDVQFEHVMRFLRAEEVAHTRIASQLDAEQAGAFTPLLEQDRRDLARDLALWRVADLQLMLRLSEQQRSAVQRIVAESTHAAITGLLRPEIADMSALLRRLDAIGAEEHAALAQILTAQQHQIFQNQVIQRRRALDFLLDDKSSAK